jgi:hypothetical protein
MFEKHSKDSYAIFIVIIIFIIVITNIIGCELFIVIRSIFVAIIFASFSFGILYLVCRFCDYYEKMT